MVSTLPSPTAVPTRLVFTSPLSGSLETVSRIFPLCDPDSISSCARDTSSSGTSSCTNDRTLPSLISGHTCSTTDLQMAAFSSVGRARRVVASTAARLRSRTLMSSSALVPPCIPMITRRPWLASAATLLARYFAPMLSRMTSAPTELLDHLDEVLVVVVDRPVGTERLTQLDLLRRSSRREHACTELPWRAGSRSSRSPRRHRARAGSRPAGDRPA